MILTRKARNKLLSRVQARVGFGLMIEIPEGLNDKEIDMYMYFRHEILRQVYYAIEEMRESK